MKTAAHTNVSVISLVNLLGLEVSIFLYLAREFNETAGELKQPDGDVALNYGD